MLKKILSKILCMGLEDELKKALELRSISNQEMSALRQRVSKGESLGDPIKDYLFVSYGTTEFLVAEEKLRKLSETVQAHNGQQVMLLYTKSETVHEGGCFGGGLSRLQIVGEQLGVLNGEVKFDVAKGDILLPTNHYVQKGDDPFFFECDDKHWKRKEGNITIPGYHFRPTLPLEDGRIPGPEMLFDDEVELYFSIGKIYFEQYLASRSKGWKDHLLRENSRIDEDFFTALNLLGTQAPPRFQEKYDKHIEIETLTIIDGLRSEHKIGRPNQGNIKNYLERAIKLGLHKEPREIELEPGVKMDIPEYIIAQCQKYKITIPE